MDFSLDINMIKPGMKPLVNIFTSAGSFLAPAGRPLTEQGIKILKNNNITEIPVELTEEEKNIYQYDYNIIPTINPSLITNTVNALRTITGSTIEDQTASMIVEYSKKIVDIITKNDDFLYRLTDYKGNADPYEHSVRTAIYAVALAKKINNKLAKSNKPDSQIEQEKLKLMDVAIAALLHDIGRLCSIDRIRFGINDYIHVNGTGKFPGMTDEKISIITDKYDAEYIPYYSLNMIKDNKTSELTSEMRLMVLLSGENNEDGPLKAQQTFRFNGSKNRLVVGAKIINICSHFDKFLMENVKEEVSLDKAYYQFLDLFAKQYFEKEYLDDFIDTIPLYPKGTKVLLQGTVNSYAVVDETYVNQLDYSRPKLVTISNQILDLREIRDTVIKQVVGDEVKMHELILKTKENEAKKLS